MSQRSRASMSSIVDTQAGLALLALRKDLLNYRQHVEKCLQLQDTLPLGPKSESSAPAGDRAQTAPLATTAQSLAPLSKAQPHSDLPFAVESAKAVWSMSPILWAKVFPDHFNPTLPEIKKVSELIAQGCLDWGVAQRLQISLILQAKEAAHIPDWTGELDMCQWFTANLTNSKFEHFRNALVRILRMSQHAGSLVPHYAWASFLIRAVAQQRFSRPAKVKGRADAFFEVYCTCRRPQEGYTMIQCDDKDCQIGWYHLRCLGLRRTPSGRWHCPACSPKPANQAVSSSPPAKELKSQSAKRPASPAAAPVAEKRARLELTTEAAESMHELLRRHFQSTDLPRLAEHLVINGLLGDQLPTLSRAELSLIIHHDLSATLAEAAGALLDAVSSSLGLLNEPPPIRLAGVKQALESQSIIGCLTVMHPALTSSRCLDFLQAAQIDGEALLHPPAECSQRWQAWSERLAEHGGLLSITEQVLLHFRLHLWCEAVMSLGGRQEKDEGSPPMFWRCREVSANGDPMTLS